ncbi:hypothetical protein CEUSTIGMA_g2320.t1 [Chlamydomonas eustigma]|uniref:OB domain-containing protein n=1 Tax=Chlamydomonas eustigma TaxID=1157962 RepID=A0A250WVK8_9CHLO|nr:hypothetical protein CEUSTIGMA_g2320.t1 [Chlamydomonas eustigma]|eukprot:GAX74874.1 hypothetical protein CEUSTIGMA_g2320.t1 [Chlamydomonas eustigma]
MQNLTPGCLANSLNLIPLSSASYLQCLGLKIIQPKIPGGPIRHRLMVSDGLNSLNVMLSSNIADLADNGAIQEGTIVRVNEFMHNEAGGKRVLIVLSMDVVGHNAGIIGDPKPLDPSQAIAAPPAALNSTTMPLTAVGPGPTYGGNVPSSNYAPHGQAGIPHSSAYSTHPPNSYQNPIAAHQTSFGGQQTHGGLQTSNAQTMGMNNNYTDSRMPVPVMNAVTGGSRPVPPPHYGAGSGAVARNEAPARIMPIRSLNPFSGRWTIKAKCTSKAEMKRWSNQKSEGKLFSFDLLDAQGGEIRVTAFNDQVDKFYDLVEVGKVYLVSKASLKHKKPVSPDRPVVLAV